MIKLPQQRELSQKITHDLFTKFEKCTFDQSSTEFLGHILSSEGIRMDPQKVEAICSWTVPRSCQEL